MSSKKISIVMAYYNRKTQLITTLNTLKFSRHKNFNVIIVDDGSSADQQIDDIIYQYDYHIKLIRIEPKNKVWVNPCIPYNIGFKHCDGEIIIIQNPEVCHIGDILSYVNDNLTIDEYYSFSCYASPDFLYNNLFDKIINNKINANKLKTIIQEVIDNINYNVFAFDLQFYIDNNPDLQYLTNFDDAFNHWIRYGINEKRICNKSKIYAPPEYIKWKGWYNHEVYHPRPLHFLSAIYAQHIKNINGFYEEYKDGLWYDDDDFLEMIKKITNVKIISNEMVFGLHQYHSEGSISHTNKTDLIIRNKNIYDIRTANCFINIPENSFSSSVKYTIFDNLKIYNNNDGIRLLINCMKNDKFFIGRIGGIEFDAYINAKFDNYNMKTIYINNLFKYCGYYDKFRSVDILKKYFEQYEQYYTSCNLLMVVNNKLASYYGFYQKNNPYYTTVYENNGELHKFMEDDPLKINKLFKISYDIIESFVYFKEIFGQLDNKKILIISPFEQEIKDQLKNKDKIFIGKNNILDFNDFKYPTFKNVEYINTYLTTNNYETPDNNIMETFEKYKMELGKKDFDIALLICGAYAYLFGNYIYNVLNKSCIHLGGIGQLFFGIKGGRYLVPYFEQLMNENWIYPYREVEENAPNVPIYDGLLGYFRRK